jgi:hypothetical protein
MEAVLALTPLRVAEGAVDRIIGDVLAPHDADAITTNLVNPADGFSIRLFT